MIHEILPSDVEFAHELLNTPHSDEEIFASLASRGIELAKAAQMVDDLRHGREPNCQAQFALGSTACRAKRGPETATADAPQATGSPRSRSRHRRHKRFGGFWYLVLLAVIFLWALWYALLKTGTDTSRDGMGFDSDQIPEAPTKDVRW